jgi:hypothetical protein
MILGEYPCCDGPLCIVLPDADLPVYSPEICPYCGVKVWHKFSRVDPESWTDDDFRKEFDVDEEKRHVLPREGVSNAQV